MSKIKERNVKITFSSLKLEGGLTIPKDAYGVILFAHGSGSSRFSPRNRYVAAILQGKGFATLLMDLLTEEEEAEDVLTGRLRFDVEMLSERLRTATLWLKQDAETRNLKIGYFGASTGAAAALIAASKMPDNVYAVVSRGGRPDLALNHLSDVMTPTLLIVGGKDLTVIEMNRKAMQHLHSFYKLEIVPGASHLFEEPGTLEIVAKLASEWFSSYIKKN